MKTDSKFPFRPPVEITCVYRDSQKDLYASSGIVNAQGEHWAFLRSKLTPSLQSRKVLSSFYPALNDICDNFVRFIKQHRDENNVVNVRLLIFFRKFILDPQLYFFLEL